MKSYESMDNLLEVVRSSDRENHLRELKRYSLLRGSSVRLAEAIVALANLNGGEILLGLNDDGTQDGTIAQPDTDRSKLVELCKHHISPRIHIEPYFVKDSQGDVMVLPVPKRRVMPFAVVDRDGNGNIKSREHYIRDAHGVTVAQDEVLAALFGETAIDRLFSATHTIITLAREDFTPVLFINDLFQHESFHQVIDLLEAAPNSISKVAPGPELARWSPYVFLSTFLLNTPPVWKVCGPRRPLPRIPEHLEPEPVQPEAVTASDWQAFIERKAFSGSRFVAPKGSSVSITLKSHSSELLISMPTGSLRFRTRPKQYSDGIPHTFRTMLLDRRSGPLFFQDPQSPYCHVSLVMEIEFLPNLASAAVEDVLTSRQWVAAISEWIDDVWGLRAYEERYPMGRIIDMERKIDALTDMVRELLARQSQ